MIFTTFSLYVIILLGENIMLPLTVLKHLRITYRKMDTKSLESLLINQKQLLNKQSNNGDCEDFNNPICQKIKMIEEELNIRKNNNLQEL